MKNKLLITIDGIRKDRLSCYNPKNQYLTPNFYRIAPECVLFEDMNASATSTGMCFASIFTGRYQKEFGRKTFGDTQNPFTDNLFKDFEDKGYKTIICLNKRFDVHARLINAFSNAEFWWTGKTLEEAGQLKDASSLRPKEQAEYFIEKADRVMEPYFAWIHLWGFSSPEKRFTDNVTPFEYDARVAELDEAVGILFDHFKEKSEMFIGADHGYALFENGRWAYGKDGHGLVEAVTSVPFLVYNGQQKGVNHELVSQTRLREIVNNPKYALDVKDSVSFCETRYVDQPDIALAVRKKKYKLVYYYDTGAHEFYDLVTDEQENMDYSGEYFHKIKRNEDGSHQQLKPYILRTDWEKLNRKKEMLIEYAMEYYGKGFKPSKTGKIRKSLGRTYRLVSRFGKKIFFQAD
jgi:hypothetical protein